MNFKEWKRKNERIQEVLEQMVEEIEDKGSPWGDDIRIGDYIKEKCVEEAHDQIKQIIIKKGSYSKGKV